MAAIAGPPVSVLGGAAAAVGALMLVLWVTSLRWRDVSIVDPAWGLAFVLVAAAGAAAGHGDLARRWLLFGLTGAWGLRLGFYLVARKRSSPGEDRRYRDMRERRRHFAYTSLVFVFAVQALLVLIISLPLQVAAGRPAALSLSAVLGVAVFALGLFFEATGDEQLRRFKSDPAHRGQVMDRGLWRYTRHPNYFGDACVWWGLWLIAVPAGQTWWTAVGPAVMTLLLVRVSGKALLERDIAGRRPGYAEYVRRTSGFLPLPPKGSRQASPARPRGESR